MSTFCIIQLSQAFICFRVLNSCVYLGPGVYMSPASMDLIHNDIKK